MAPILSTHEVTCQPGARGLWQWIRRYIRYHGTRHPRDMAEPEVQAFLTYLAVERSVAASTQVQALSALLFLYDAVLGRPLDTVHGIVRATKPPRLPTVLAQHEVGALLAQMNGTHRIIASLLYGAGLRLKGALRLRVKDIDLDRRQLTTVQDLPGHAKIHTTQVYLQVADLNGIGIRSPLDALA